MEMLKRYTCCFFGHRKIHETDELKKRLYDEIEKLILQENVYIFLFGSKSQFDDLCYSVVTRLKKKYPDIKRVYVRAEFPYINEDYRSYILDKYEDTYYPEKILSAGRAAYVERNREMTDKSSFCICFYNADIATSQQRSVKSGTEIAVEYAKRKELKIKNINE